MHIVRKHSVGDWHDVIAQVRKALTAPVMGMPTEKVPAQKTARCEEKEGYRQIERFMKRM
jgi:hypothetical protein